MKSQKGFTLIELMITLIMLVIGIVWMGGIVFVIIQSIIRGG